MQFKDNKESLNKDQGTEHEKYFYRQHRQNNKQLAGYINVIRQNQTCALGKTSTHS